MTRIYYLRNPGRITLNKDRTYSVSKGEPVICLVSERNTDTGEIKYGYAIFNPKDRFDRKRTRAIAFGRLGKKPATLISTGKSCFEINKSIIEHFAESVGSKSSLAKKMAKTWLQDAEEYQTKKEIVQISPN